MNTQTPPTYNMYLEKVTALLKSIPDILPYFTRQQMVFIF